jgi:hypothetical protein
MYRFEDDGWKLESVSSRLDQELDSPASGQFLLRELKIP